MPDRGIDVLLPGFGPKSSAALAAVGVTSRETLERRDPYDLYGELKARDSRVSLNFLYAILAAREGCDWREIQKTRRTEILLALDDRGLAPRRKPASRVTLSPGPSPKGEGSKAG